MKQYIHATVIILASVLLLSLNGCSDSSDGPQSPTSSNKICTKWGISKDEVIDYMNNYETGIIDDNFLCYQGKNEVQTISYQISDDKLQASLVIIPSEKTSLSELQASFKKYEYLGEKNGINIYVSEAENTIATISQKTISNTTYYAIGYTALK